MNFHIYSFKLESNQNRRAFKNPLGGSGFMWSYQIVKSNIIAVNRCKLPLPYSWLQNVLASKQSHYTSRPQTNQNRRAF